MGIQIMNFLTPPGAASMPKAAVDLAKRRLRCGDPPDMQGVAIARGDIKDGKVNRYPVTLKIGFTPELRHQGVAARSSAIVRLSRASLFPL